MTEEQQAELDKREKAVEDAKETMKTAEDPTSKELALNLAKAIAEVKNYRDSLERENGPA